MTVGMSNDRTTEPTAPQVIGSTFALLDVKRGRAALRKATQQNDRIPVTITGYITGPFGGDDGVSQEFQIKVTGVKVS